MARKVTEEETMRIVRRNGKLFRFLRYVTQTTASFQAEEWDNTKVDWIVLHHWEFLKEAR